MPRPSRPPRATDDGVSLTFEVSHLRLAVECARRTLADAEFVEGPEYQQRRLEAQAVLELVSARMTQVVSVLKGDAQPASIRAEHNASPDTESDVVLAATRRTTT